MGAKAQAPLGAQARSSAADMEVKNGQAIVDFNYARKRIVGAIAAAGNFEF